MKNNQHITITLSGEVRGTLFWPVGAEFNSEVSTEYALTDNEPFRRKWEGLESALNDMRDEVSGDSSTDPEITYARLTIRREQFTPTDYNPQNLYHSGATERYYYPVE